MLAMYSKTGRTSSLTVATDDAAEILPIRLLRVASFRNVSVIILKTDSNAELWSSIGTMRTGFAQLPLHTGKAPAWLFSRMSRLAREIICHIVSEYGPDEVLRRLSDPFWFQAFGCVLGFDWHSSGVTTTTTGAIKEGIKGLEGELGLWAAGGKGGASRKTPREIVNACERTGDDPERLVYASRMSAKVDSAAVQDGYQLYHHGFFFTKSGCWCVVQQGMNEEQGIARRYHWLGERLENFVCEPHAAICCDTRGATLNLVARESEDVRTTSTKLASRPWQETLEVIQRLPELIMPSRHAVSVADINRKYLGKILLRTYECAPTDFEGLLGIQGVGPRTLRALALASELIYGTAASTRDPARFSFAHGGKDGTPFAVDRRTYEQTITILHTALNRAKVDRSEKVQALRRLAQLEMKSNDLGA
jgi:hypothetical protein